MNKENILFLEQFWRMSKSGKNLRFLKCSFQQHIHIARKNLQIIRERNCYIGKHFKLNLKNEILTNGCCGAYTSSPAAPPKTFLEKLRRWPLLWLLNYNALYKMGYKASYHNKLDIQWTQKLLFIYSILMKTIISTVKYSPNWSTILDKQKTISYNTVTNF